MKYFILPQALILGLGAMEFLINKYWLIARDAEPSTVFLTHTIDTSTVLGTVILKYDFYSSTVLQLTLLSPEPLLNCKYDTYSLYIVTVKLPKCDVICTY